MRRAWLGRRISSAAGGGPRLIFSPRVGFGLGCAAREAVLGPGVAQERRSQKRWADLQVPVRTAPTALEAGFRPRPIYGGAARPGSLPLAPRDGAWWITG